MYIWQINSFRRYQYPLHITHIILNSIENPDCSATKPVTARRPSSSRESVRDSQGESGAYFLLNFINIWKKCMYHRNTLFSVNAQLLLHDILSKLFVIKNNRSVTTRFESDFNQMKYSWICSLRSRPSTIALIYIYIFFFSLICIVFLF